MSERESRPGESGPFVSTVKPSDEELVDGLARRRMDGWTTRPLTRTGGPLDAVPVTGGMSGGMYGTLLSEDIIPTGGGPRVDKIHGIMTDDPQLLSAVVKAIDGYDGAAVMIIAEKFHLSGVEAGEVLAAVLGEGKRPAGCFLNKRGRLEVMATAEEMQRSAARVSTSFHRTIQPDGFGVDSEAEERVDALMGRHMADWKTYPLTLDAPSLTGLTLTMPSATTPSGVRSLSLEEIDAVFSALDDEARQTGEDLEEPSETLAWMCREVARFDTFESAFLAVNELCPPSDWLRDLKAASHDPDALVELMRRATAARAEKDKAGSEGFQTPCAPAQPSPALFDADQPDWLPEGWTCRLGSYTGPGGERVFTHAGRHVVAWGSTHPDIEAWTEWTEQDKRALVMALADPWRVTGPGGGALDLDAELTCCPACGGPAEVQHFDGDEDGTESWSLMCSSPKCGWEFEGSPRPFTMRSIIDGCLMDSVPHVGRQVLNLLARTTRPPTFAGLAELRDVGFLQELNRLVLHPAGLALGLTMDGTTGKVLDVTVAKTDDLAGWSFGFRGMTDEERGDAWRKADNVAVQVMLRRKGRMADGGLVRVGTSVIEAIPNSMRTWESEIGLLDEGVFLNRHLSAVNTAVRSFILADTCLDATPYEKGAHDAATAILRGDLSTGDPRVTLLGQVEEARQTAHAMESMLVQVRAERDRALAVLAAETGKQGLPGWVWDPAEREWTITLRGGVLMTAWGDCAFSGPGFCARRGAITLIRSVDANITDAIDAMEKATAWARSCGHISA